MYSLLRFLIMVFVSMAVWMAIGLGVKPCHDFVYILGDFSRL